MAVQTYTATVSEHALLKGSFQYITFELKEPNHLDFQSGQYVMLKVPGQDARRSYSIASSPALGHRIDLLVDVKPQGPGCSYLQSLQPGDTVEFMAPAGMFVLADDPEEEQLVMIATGSGISAIRSMILDTLQVRNDTRPIKLHWGLRYAEDLFWEEEFRMLERTHENFHFDLVLSKGPDDWPMCKGHVTDCLRIHYETYATTGFYMCGNTRMVHEVSEFLAQHGVGQQHIHHEKFY